MLLILECVHGADECAVRYEYHGDDVYQLSAEEECRGRVVAMLIWVRNTPAFQNV